MLRIYGSQRDWFVLLVTTLMLVAGCVNRHSHPTMIAAWDSDARFPPEGCWYHTRQMYPDYGIIGFRCDVKPTSSDEEFRVLKTALMNCRATYQDAYRYKLLTRYETNEAGMRDSKPLSLKFVAVCLNGTWREIDANQTSITSLGFVVPAHLIFADPIDEAEIRKQTFRSERKDYLVAPDRFDGDQYSDSRYGFIEAHEAEVRLKQNRE